MYFLDEKQKEIWDEFKAWLEDNVSMNSSIHFDNECKVKSDKVLQVIEAIEEELKPRMELKPQIELKSIGDCLESMLVLSTMHVMPENIEAGHENCFPCMIASDKFGATFFVPADDSALEAEKDNVVFCKIMRRAMEINCKYVKFEEDGFVCEEFEIFYRRCE